MIRSIELPFPMAVPAIEPPLRILLAAAASTTHGTLELSREIELIQKELKGVAEVIALKRTSLESLREAMLRRPFHILHFMGHGAFDPETGTGALLLETEAGSENHISGEMLATHLQGCLPYLAVINACNSARSTSRSDHGFFAGVASALVLRGLPAVVAMRSLISDAAAIAFSKVFYRELAANESVDAAVVEGRIAIYGASPRSLEWATPVLFMRTSDGHLLRRNQLDPVKPPRKAALQTQRAILGGASAAAPIIPWRPWQDLQSPMAVDVFRLLDWHARLTPLVGREEDLQEIVQWANSKADVLIRFLVGPGGSGKTRLALEAAATLREDGWDAGQIFLGRRYPKLTADTGVFWVVDYPEAWRPQVEELLRNLARVESTSAPVRVLLLSRLFMRDWLPLIDAAAAASICDVQEVRLGPLTIPSAVDLFHAASARLAKLLGQPLPALSTREVAEWLDRDRESNPLPLFVIAAALHSVLSESHELSLSGSEIVAALVRRERMRLDNIGRRAKWRDGVLSRVFALATVSGGLDAETLHRLAADGDLGLPAEHPVDAIKSLGFWEGRRVAAPSPDIVAAELLFEILDDSSDQASEWLWLCLIDTAAERIDRLGRIAYDIARLRGPEDFRRFASWLAAAIDGQSQRAKKWRQIFVEDRLPLGLIQLAVAIGETLLRGQIAEESERANILTILSDRLSDTGNSAAALESSREAVGIYRRLVAGSPQAYEQDMARSLRSLSLCLRKENDPAGALNASREAVEIWRRLAAAEPTRYDPDLARILRIVSICLSEAKEGDTGGALEAIHEAVKIWRRLVRTNSALYEHDLALSLNTLSVLLGEMEDQEAALHTIREAVEIWRRLAETNPARFEPDLAYGLNNLSSFLRVAGDEKGSIEAVQGAIKIYGRVAAANPARYEPDLARSLDNLYLNLSDTENPEAMVNAMREATQIQRSLVAASPTSYEPGLSQRLDRLSQDLSDPGHAADVLEALRVARNTVVILLVRGEAPNGDPIFAYVGVRADKLEEFMEAQKSGMFYPEDFGVIVESGQGDPQPDVRKKMETEYGFNHDLMVDIPDSEQARQIVNNLDQSPPVE